MHSPNLYSHKIWLSPEIFALDLSICEHVLENILFLKYVTPNSRQIDLCFSFKKKKKKKRLPSIFRAQNDTWTRFVVPYLKKRLQIFPYGHPATATIRTERRAVPFVEAQVRRVGSRTKGEKRLPKRWWSLLTTLVAPTTCVFLVNHD